MPGKRYLQIVDLILWVGVASSAIVAASLIVGLVVGGDLLTGKYVLFVVGFLVFGLGSLLMQPTGPPGPATEGRPSEAGARQPSSAPGGSEFGTVRDPIPGLETLRDQFREEPTRQYRFEARLQGIGPLAEHDLPLEERVGRPYKIFATSLVVLAFSLAMELIGVQA